MILSSSKNIPNSKSCKLIGGSEAISLLDALSNADFLPHANLDVLAKEDVASYHHHKNSRRFSQLHCA